MSVKRLVHIVDDDHALLDSLTMLLEASGFDARQYESAETFLAGTEENLVGCVVTDVCRSEERL